MAAERAVRARPPPRALPAPLCLRPGAPPAPAEPIGEGTVQLWELAEPVLVAELAPGVLRWRIALDPLKPAPREVRYDMLRTFVGGRLVGEDDKGVMFLSRDVDKSLS